MNKRTTPAIHDQKDQYTTDWEKARNSKESELLFSGKNSWNLLELLPYVQTGLKKTSWCRTNVPC